MHYWAVTIKLRVHWHRNRIRRTLECAPRGPAPNDPGEVTFLLGGCIAKFGSRERAALILTAVTDQCRNHPDKVAHCCAPVRGILARPKTV